MLVDQATLLAFIPAAIALNLTPGADMLFCIGQGLKGGPRAALAADAGIALGVLVHVVVAGLGLGALVAASPVAFDVIRWVGIAYLLWLAWGALREPAARDGRPPLHPSRAFRDAFVVNLTNPKVILFVLAFVPQFVNPERPLLAQFLVFGLIISLGGLIVNGLAGVFAGGMGRAVAGSRGFGRAVGWVTATIFGALAVKLALTQRA